MSPDKSLRDACTQADTQLSTYSVESNARPDVYRAVLAYAETAEAKGLTGERKRYLERRLRDFRMPHRAPTPDYQLFSLTTTRDPRQVT